MEITFKGKVALVTAGSKGIGRAVAKGLYENGAKVAICARGKEGLDKATQEIAGGDKSRFFSMAGDIGDASFLRDLVAQATERLGPIDILVNNNGGPPAGEALQMTEEAWMGALNRNLLSVVRLCALTAPAMKKKGWGRIINLTSLTAKEPDGGMVLSSVARAGVAAYAKTIAGELGPFGITVNTILTGGVLTERMYNLVSKDIEGTGETMEQAVARIGKTLPVQHVATPEEFIQTVLFIASDKASYLTGTAIPVDGGASKHTF